MVSVITPTFNSEQFIAKTITSIVEQTYQHWELIIVDDASTDKTRTIIEAFAKKDNRITLITHAQNQGAGIARNTAVKNAKGDYIAFLDADDLWRPNKLEIQLQFMKENNVNVCFSSYELINENGESLNKIIEALPSLSYKKQLKCNYIGNLTGMYNAKALGKLPISKLRKRQDWVMWLDILKKAGMAKGIKESLAYYRVRKESMSASKMELITYNYLVYRKALGFGFIKSTIYLLRFLYEYFIIKSKQIKSIKTTV